MGGFAWVTLATNDSYSLGALVLAHSLRQVGTVHQLAVLVTPGVTNPMRQKLATVFNVVQEVNILDSRDEANLRLLKRPELGITFTKLHCWRLTQFEKCVFLDADTLVLVNSDELFDREEFSAAPDVGWPDCFNSGVFVFRPSNGTYSKLVEFAIEKGSFDGGDQGLLNLYFSDWAHKDISKHLPFIYNMCSTASYSYLPAFKQFGADVKIVHFIGPAKPWLQYFDTESRTVHPSSNLQHLRGVLQTWWDIFCSLIHPNLSPDMARSRQPAEHLSPTYPSYRNPPQTNYTPRNKKDSVIYHDQPQEVSSTNNYEFESVQESFYTVVDPWDEFDQRQSVGKADTYTETLQVIIVEPPASETSDRTYINYPSPVPCNYSDNVDCSTNKNVEHVDRINNNHFETAVNFGEIPTNDVESCTNTTNTPYISESQPPVTQSHNNHDTSNFSNNNCNNRDVTCDKNVECKKSQNYETLDIGNDLNASSYQDNISNNRSEQVEQVYPELSPDTSYPNLRTPALPNECEPTSTVSTEITSLHATHNDDAASDSDSGLAGAFAQFTLGVKRTASQDALENHLRRQGWEVGNIDYMGRDSFDNIWSKICETLASAPPPPQQAPEAKPREPTPSSDLLQDKPSTPVAETTIHTTESPVEVETAKTESVPTSEPVDTLVAQAVPKPDVTLETAPTDIISEVGLQSQTEPVSQQASEPAAPIQPVTPTEAVAQVPPTQLPQAPQTEADSQQVPETQAPAQQAPQTEASPQTEVAPQLVTQTEVAPQRLPQTEAVPQVPQTEAAPQVPQTEAVPQVPQTEAVPQVPQTEAVPQAPQTETVPQVPQTEAVPQVPQTEAAPQASETEAAPQLPQTEGVPQAPQTGAEPQQVSQTEAATQQVSQTEVAPQQVSQAEAATQQGPQIEVEPQKVPQAEAIPQTEAALQQVPQTEVSQPDAAGLQTEGDPSEVIQPAQLEPIQSPKTQETSQPQATSDVAQQATETPVMQQQTPEPLQELPKPEGQQATETPVIQPKTPEPLQELPKPEGQQQVSPQDAPIETSKVELAQEASEQTIISQEVPQETLQQDVAVPRDTPKPEVLQEVTKPEAEAAQKKSQPEVSQEVLPAAPSSELPQEQSRPEVPQASPVKSQQLPTEAPTTEIKQGTKPAQEETPAVPETIVQEKPKVTKKTTKEGKEKKVVKKTPKSEPATEGAESSKAVGPAETTAEAAASEATPTPPPRKTTTVKKVVKPKK